MSSTADPRYIPRRVVSILLGLILLTAAVLKWRDPDPSTTENFPLLSTPVGQTALIEVEGVLGLWLISGLALRWAWLAAIFFFTALAGTSVYLGLNGFPTCSCFGAKVSINPWYTLTFDVAALGALVILFPRKASPGSSLTDGPTLGTALRFFSVTAVLLIGFFVGMSWFYGSPSRALNRLRGDTIVISPYRTYLGHVSAPVGVWFSVQVTNRTEDDILIVGGKSGCRCLETYDVPVQIPSGGVVNVRLHVNPPYRTGPFEGWFRLLTDNREIATASFYGIADDITNPSSE